MNSQVLSLVLSRLFVALITLVIVSFAVFFATTLLPGDTATILLGQAATPEAVEGLRKAMHLDEPALFRFLRWLVGLLQGDLGTSYANEMPIAALIAGRFVNTLKLAWRHRAFLRADRAHARDHCGDAARHPLRSDCHGDHDRRHLRTGVHGRDLRRAHLRRLPEMAAYALSFANEVHSMTDLLRVYAMPVITLTFVVSAQMIRMTRAAVIETLNTPYVEMALLKGASRPRIVFRHALPNALGPIVNAVALSLSYLLGGVIIVETIFNYPGIAKLMLDAVATRDLPLIQSCAMIFCLGYLLLITIADIIAILSNPRLR